MNTPGRQYITAVQTYSNKWSLGVTRENTNRSLNLAKYMLFGLFGSEYGKQIARDT